MRLLNRSPINFLRIYLAETCSLSNWFNIFYVKYTKRRHLFIPPILIIILLSTCVLFVRYTGGLYFTCGLLYLLNAPVLFVSLLVCCNKYKLPIEIYALLMRRVLVNLMFIKNNIFVNVCLKWHSHDLFFNIFVNRITVFQMMNQKFNVI